MSRQGRPALGLVWSRKDHAVIGSVRLSVAPPRTTPRCDAVVLEEDTWQVLAAGPELSICREHPIRLWTGVLDAEPLAPGTVLLREGWPLTMVTVVYDFDSVPCCRSRWVAAALAETFRICRERRVRSLLLPLPGVSHGRLSPRKAFRLVVRAIGEDPHGELRQVLLVCPPGEMEGVRRLLAAEASHD
jgi:hypothetical protein